MSPEYATYGLFSVKSDVFSFGVVVLEIVTGMRNKGFTYRDHHVNLLAYVSITSCRNLNLFLSEYNPYDIEILIWR